MLHENFTGISQLSQEICYCFCPCPYGDTLYLDFLGSDHLVYELDRHHLFPENEALQEQRELKLQLEMEITD